MGSRGAKEHGGLVLRAASGRHRVLPWAGDQVSVVGREEGEGGWEGKKEGRQMDERGEVEGGRRDE